LIDGVRKKIACRRKKVVAIREGFLRIFFLPSFPTALRPPMKKRENVILAFAIAALIIPSATAKAQTPVLYYNFDANALGALSTGAVIDNVVGTDGTFRNGTLGGTGTIFNGGVVAGGNLGRALQFTPFADGNQNLEAPNINTNFTLSSIGITPSSPYTAMAWLNFASIAGDNMIFGEDGATALPGGESLHHGSRNGNYHSGHWGDDVGPDQGQNVATGTNVWHHVAFTNDATGLQKIYVDGVERLSGGAGTAGAMDITKNLLIGTSNNGGSFSGGVDEIKIYNQLLTPAQIQAASIVIPEPASIGLLLASGCALALRRRRERL
jgi:hypothetical protein